MRTHVRTGAALLLALFLALAGFVGWQYGIPAYQRAQTVPAYSPSEDLALPSQVYDPPPYVASTDSVGRPGPVGLAFQGLSARDGLSGVVHDPWYVVSSRSGAYEIWNAVHGSSTLRASPLRLSSSNSSLMRGGSRLIPRGC